MEIFDQELGEIQLPDGIRFIMRRNLVRADEMKQSRQQKYQALTDFVEKLNTYLQEHPRAEISVAERKAKAKSKQLKIHEWTVIESCERTLIVIKILNNFRMLKSAMAVMY